MKKVSSWGRLNAHEHEVIECLGSLKNPAKGSVLPFGMGRSYGDVCLNPQGILYQTSRLDRFEHFDAETGMLTCQAGVLIQDIQRIFIPQGWILPVSPGTQFVTIGGAIANDIHGKNHYSAGSFGNHVNKITLIRTSGEILECTPEDALFQATIGGLGLTGVILKATIQLKKTPGAWLECETIAYHSLEEFLQLSSESEAQFEYTVSWVDCAYSKGIRGLFMRANFDKVQDTHQIQNKKPLTIPLTPPISLINQYSLKPFNALYYFSQKRKSKHRTHYIPFFYPLDSLLKWNRLYGPKGFYQYQCVIPFERADAMKALLAYIQNTHSGSFLSVLKTFGPIQSVGMLSFPRSGITLALDFPNLGERTLKCFIELDKIVYEAGGCLYPAKDARMPCFMFEAGYSRLNEFMHHRDAGISSAFSRRLMGS